MTHNLKEKIIEQSKKIGIDKLAIASAEPFYELIDFYKEYQKREYSTGFEEQDINKRVDPKLSLPSVKSIIVIAVAYPVINFTNIGDKNLRGVFCRASWGKDYHLVLKEKLDKLASFIKELVPGTETLSMVDTGPLSDRAVAKRAGLGFIGKNSSLITPEYGSFVYIGQLLTSLPLPPDNEIENGCGDCRICVDACPMKAIKIEEGYIDSKNCLAYLTLNKKFIDNNIKEKISLNGYIYGCDNCQLVCPYNKDKLNDWHEEFTPSLDIAYPLLQDMIFVSNRDFKEKYAEISGSWRGKKPLQRNAILLLSKRKNENNLEILKEVFLNDPRPELRDAALWALLKYEMNDVKETLFKGLEKEENERVRGEIVKALNNN